MRSPAHRVDSVLALDKMVRATTCNPLQIAPCQLIQHFLFFLCRKGRTLLRALIFGVQLSQSVAFHRLLPFLARLINGCVLSVIRRYQPNPNGKEIRRARVI